VISQVGDKVLLTDFFAQRALFRRHSVRLPTKSLIPGYAQNACSRSPFFRS